MLNVPLPGGTTGHAVGSVLSAIVLGPWLSILATSIALVIQALFFGDGGILTLGANIFNMAIVMSLVGYGMFLLLKKLFPNPKSYPFLAGISGYIAINTAALLAGVELGLQPLLFKSAAGQALYFPYPLRVSVPAMMIGHLTIAGLAEALITSFAYLWLERQHPQLLHDKISDSAAVSWRSFFVVCTTLIFIVPLGLLAPGTAWGEWGREELAHLGLGYVPQGFDKWSNIINSPLKDYDFPILRNQTVGYVVSALVGVVCILLIMKGITFLIERTQKNTSATHIK